MITKKSKSRPSTRTWPYTPEPSPPLDATNIQIVIGDDFKMSSTHSQPRPISGSTKKDIGQSLHAYRPTLDDVLTGRAPDPYTLEAYTAFLSQQHCLETLDFVTEAKNYTVKYDEAAVTYCGMPLTTDTDEGFDLMQEWVRILDVFVKPGAPREINLPAEERDDLVDEPYDPRPPKPEALDPAVRRMRDLMSDSIFIPFCNSVKKISHAATYTAPSDTAQRKDVSERSTRAVEKAHSQHRQNSRRRSPPTSSGFQPSRSPPQATNKSSALTSALHRSNSGRLATHASNASAVSESALTDDSGGGESPSAGDLDFTSPPLTPPSSDLPMSQSIHVSSASYLHPTSNPAFKPMRSESGGWKRLGNKIFGQKKKGPYSPYDDQ